MSFGKRETLPSWEERPRPSPTPAHERGRGRIGYLWALLAIAASGFAGPAIMAAAPAINPSGASQAEVARATLEGVVPPLLIASVIILPLVDLALKALRQRSIWLYGVLSAIGLVLLINGLMSIGSPSKPLWILRLALAPGLIGGLVLGFFRTR